MKTTIVCGVLGAGKTTFIRNILKQGVEKTVVLVNDFGSAGIDGEIMSAGGIETIEMPSGCVCCTLRFDLITTIQKITDELKPEHLFIEPSGIAAPSGILEALATLKLQQVAVVGVVDATEFIDAFEAEMYGWFFKSQVTRSDIVLVNKTDLADKQKIEKTVQLVEKLNPYAIIIPTVNAAMNIGLIKHKKKAGQEEPAHDHVFRAETVTIKFDKPVELNVIKKVFDKLAKGEYGNVVRAKALIQCKDGPYRLDLASKQVSFERFINDIKDSRLVIIGTGLQEEKIMTIAQKT